MSKYHMIVERTSSGGYAAHWRDGAIFSGGKSFEELKTNMVEALNFGLDKEDVMFEDLKLTYDIPSFFEANPAVNAAGLAREIGMTKSLLSQYASGTKKPSAVQATKILEGIRAVGRKLAELDFAF